MPSSLSPTTKEHPPIFIGEYKYHYSSSYNNGQSYIDAVIIGNQRSDQILVRLPSWSIQMAVSMMGLLLKRTPVDHSQTKIWFKLSMQLKRCCAHGFLFMIIEMVQMQGITDDLAISHRSRNAESIWVEVINAISSKYAGFPIHMMTKGEIISLVENKRHGGRKADRLQDIENPNLSLSLDGMCQFLCFNTPVYDPAALTISIA